MSSKSPPVSNLALARASNLALTVSYLGMYSRCNPITPAHAAKRNWSEAEAAGTRFATNVAASKLLEFVPSALGNKVGSPRRSSTRRTPATTHLERTRTAAGPSWWKGLRSNDLSDAALLVGPWWARVCVRRRRWTYSRPLHTPVGRHGASWRWLTPGVHRHEATTPDGSANTRARRTRAMLPRPSRARYRRPPSPIPAANTQSTLSNSGRSSDDQN